MTPWWMQLLELAFLAVVVLIWVGVAVCVLALPVVGFLLARELVRERRWRAGR